MTDLELEARLKVITDLIKDIKRVADRHETDTEKEIGDLRDFVVELARLGAIVEAVHKGQSRQTEKIVDQVEEVTSAVIDETQDLHETIKSKKFIAFKSHHWWNPFNR